MPRSRTSNGSDNSSASLGFEAKLWLPGNKLRNNMDAAEYKHVVLGLIFLKYISNTFDEYHGGQTDVGTQNEGVPFLNDRSSFGLPLEAFGCGSGGTLQPAANAREAIAA